MLDDLNSSSRGRSKGKVADLLEQTEPQAKDHDPIITDESLQVKLEISDLTSLRTVKGLLAKDMVEVVRVLYPKYDRMLHSKCEHGEEYGIALRADALNALFLKYAPEVMERKKRKRRKDTNRVQARLTETVAKLFRAALVEDGYSIQGWIEKQIYDYLRRKRDVRST